jgi:glycolate oxidase iron-sulfur subunit
MIEAARAQAEPARPERDSLPRRIGLTGVLPRRRLTRALGLGLGLAQALRLDRVVVPPQLRASTPRVSLREQARPLRARGSGPTAAVLTGCIMDLAFRPVHRAALRIVGDAGYRATPVGGCCGALAMHHGYPDAARRMARERIAALEGADLVVIDAAGCSAHVKEYGHLLADEPEWAERARRVAARTVDLVEVAVADRERPLGPVAVHDACHHVHAQGIAAEPRGMLRAAGAEPVEVPNGARCCGAAGLYSVLQPELSGELRRQKAEAIASTGAPVVSVANPGCAIQIAAGLRELGVATEVRHPAELVATRPRRPHGRVRGPLGRLRRR